MALLDLVDRQAVAERDAADGERLAGLWACVRRKRSVLHAEIAGALRRVGNGDERRQVGRRRQFLADHRAVAGNSSDGSGRLPRVHVLGAQLVSRQRVGDAAEDRELVGALGQLRQVLADLDAGDVGLDRVELAAVLPPGHPA